MTENLQVIDVEELEIEDFGLQDHEVAQEISNEIIAETDKAAQELQEKEETAAERIASAKFALEADTGYQLIEKSITRYEVVYKADGHVTYSTNGENGEQEWKEDESVTELCDAKVRTYSEQKNASVLLNEYRNEFDERVVEFAIVQFKEVLENHIEDASPNDVFFTNPQLQEVESQKNQSQESEQNVSEVKEDFFAFWQDNARHVSQETQKQISWTEPVQNMMVINQENEPIIENQKDINVKVEFSSLLNKDLIQENTVSMEQVTSDFSLSFVEKESSVLQKTRPIETLESASIDREASEPIQKNTAEFVVFEQLQKEADEVTNFLRQETLAERIQVQENQEIIQPEQTDTLRETIRDKSIEKPVISVQPEIASVQKQPDNMRETIQENVFNSVASKPDIFTPLQQRESVVRQSDNLSNSTPENASFEASLVSTIEHSSSSLEASETRIETTQVIQQKSEQAPFLPQEIPEKKVAQAPAFETESMSKIVEQAPAAKTETREISLMIKSIKANFEPVAQAILQSSQGASEILRWGDQVLPDLFLGEAREQLQVAIEHLQEHLSTSSEAIIVNSIEDGTDAVIIEQSPAGEVTISFYEQVNLPQADSSNLVEVEVAQPWLVKEEAEEKSERIIIGLKDNLSDLRQKQQPPSKVVQGAASEEKQSSPLPFTASMNLSDDELTGVSARSRLNGVNRQLVA